MNEHRSRPSSTPKRTLILTLAAVAAMAFAASTASAAGPPSGSAGAAPNAGPGSTHALHARRARGVTAPRSLRVIGRTRTSITVRWVRPIGPVAGFTAYLNRRVKGRTAGRAFTFRRLACGRAYIIGVGARGRTGGASRISAAVVRTRACSRLGAYSLASGGAGLPARLPASTGATFHVATNGSDANPGTTGAPWRTVGKAIRTLAPGQTAMVRGGVYNESLTLDRGGAPGATITIRSAPGQTAVIHSAREMALDMVRGGAYVRFQGLVFEGATGSSTTNVYAESGAHHIELFACVIRGSARQGFFSDAGTSAIHIIASHFHDNGGSGPSGLDHNIYIQGSNHVVASSLVRGARNGYGIQIYPSNTGIVVAANTVVDNAEGGIIVGSDSGGTTTGARIVGNILAYNGGAGLATYWGGSSGSDNIERGNLGFGNSGGNLTGTSIAHQAQLIADPLFVNRAGGDFRLNARSPARNRNDPAYAPATDLFGNPRPLGGGPDLGAVEG